MALPEAEFADLRVGVIGAGGISHDHVRSWLELGAQVTAYSRSGAAVLVRDYGVAEAESLDELLQTCDVVDICTPTTTHPGLVRAAIEAGVPIICEKPLALTAGEAQRLVDEAREAGVPLYPAHVVRFTADYRAAKRAVDEGELGTVAVARLRRSGEFPTWGRWFADEQESGGIVLDQMIHDLDFAEWVCGPVISVHGMRSAAMPGSFVVSAQLQLRHVSGAISFVTGIWGAPGLRFSTSFSIVGDAGVLTHDSRDSALTESPYTTQLRELARAVRGEGSARVTGADGARAVRVARAAMESIATGLPVSLAAFAERAASTSSPLSSSAATEPAGVVHVAEVGRVIAATGVSTAAASVGPETTVFSQTADFVEHLERLTGERPVRVFASENTAAAVGIVSIRFSGGMMATICCSWRRPEAVPTAGESMLELVGTDASTCISAGHHGHRTTRSTAALDVVRAAQASVRSGQPVDLGAR